VVDFGWVTFLDGMIHVFERFENRNSKEDRRPIPLLLFVDPAEKVTLLRRFRSHPLEVSGMLGSEHESSEFRFAGFPFW